MEELSTKFISLIKRCTQHYANKCPDKVAAHKHIRRALIAIEECPNIVVEASGAKLWKYRDLVLSNDISNIDV